MARRPESVLSAAERALPTGTRGGVAGGKRLVARAPRQEGRNLRTLHFARIVALAGGAEDSRGDGAGAEACAAIDFTARWVSNWAKLFLARSVWRGDANHCQFAVGGGAGREVR